MTAVAYNKSTTSETPCIKTYNTEHKYINFGLFEVATWKWTQLELPGSWCLVFPSSGRWNPSQKRIQWPTKIRHSRTSRSTHTQHTPEQTREKTPSYRRGKRPHHQKPYETLLNRIVRLSMFIKPSFHRRNRCTTHNNCGEHIVTFSSSLDGSLVREP